MLFPYSCVLTFENEDVFVQCNIERKQFKLLELNL